MADLFSMKSPLQIRFPNGEVKVMAEYFKHPEGLVFFDLFWLEDIEKSIHLIKGEYKGEGPWKVGEAVVSVLGCHGCDPDLATQFSEWQTWMQMYGSEYPGENEINVIAKKYGALIS